MRIVKWGSVTICKTNVLKDTILNFLKIVTKITVGIPGISPFDQNVTCLLYTSPSPRDGLLSRMPSSA